MGFAEQTVLVVEDHDFQRRQAVRCLRDLGIEGALEAVNGRDALNQLLVLEKPVDLVLCDLDMPEMDGVEFISYIALNKLAQALIVVSGMEPAILHTVETMARAYGIQVLGTIRKPIAREQLSACLSRYLPAPEAGVEGPSGAAIPAEDLRRGLELGEFIPAYQPKVSLATGDLAGVEVLARWFRPGQGLWMPRSFLPRLEAEGLLTGLLESMFAQGCAQLRAWDRQGLALTASVNLSILSLSDPEIADRLEARARTEDCEPSRLTFELIETGAMPDLAPALQAMARLRLKGFGLSMDSFGQGHASLHQLSNIPFTELKVDQASMREAQDGEWNRNLVELCLEMARRLSLRTVAERVETREDWEAAQAMGWDEAQGYFIARPLAGHELPEWAGAWHARRAER